VKLMYLKQPSIPATSANRLIISFAPCLAIVSCNSLLHVPSASDYDGVVIVKRAQDEPVTDEPVVVAFARVIQQRRPLIPATAALGLQDDKVRLSATS
jgi:hypothetical protein